MLHADRDVGRLVLFEKEHLLATRDARRAGHHDPVLGAVMMQLQRERRAGVYLQAFHLEARPVLDAVVAAPGTEHLPMQRILGAPQLFQPQHQLLHVLYVILRRHQHRVLGLDDHVVLESHRGHQAALGIQVAPVGVFAEHVPAYDVTVRVGVARLVERRPGADITPARLERHHYRIRGLFHDGIVDRVGWARLEGRGVDAGEIQIRGRAAKRRRADLRDLGYEALQFLEIPPGAEHEHAAVPVVVVGFQELEGALKLGFLHEACDAKRGALSGAALDVAVAGLSSGRDHPEGDELSRLCGAERGAHRLLEGRRVPHQVIGREYQQHRTGRLRARGNALERRMRGECDGRRGVAPAGLEECGAWRDLKLTQLLRDQEAVRLVAYNHGRGRPETLETEYRLLQEGVRPGQRQQLLGIQLARQRPQACAGSAAENDWSEHRRPRDAPAQGVTSGLPRPMAW